MSNIGQGHAVQLDVRQYRDRYLKSVFHVMDWVSRDQIVLTNVPFTRVTAAVKTQKMSCLAIYAMCFTNVLWFVPVGQVSLGLSCWWLHWTLSRFASEAVHVFVSFFACLPLDYQAAKNQLTGFLLELFAYLASLVSWAHEMPTWIPWRAPNSALSLSLMMIQLNVVGRYQLDASPLPRCPAWKRSRGSREFNIFFFILIDIWDLLFPSSFAAKLLRS